MTIDLPASQFLIYQTEDGRTKIDVRFEGESVWLTQQMMVELFQSSKQNVSHHIRSIFAGGELQPEATVKKYLTVQTEGKRQVQRLIEYYNLDMIISVGYRVKSHVATKHAHRLVEAKSSDQELLDAADRVTSTRKSVKKKA